MVSLEVSLLRVMEQECWTLRCVDIQTGGGDADVGWEVVSHHQAKPHDRVIASGCTPEEALRKAAHDVVRTEPQTAPDDGKKEYVRACRKGELCTYGPKEERRREWRLLFEDTDKGPCVFDNETEAIDAWIAASGNWTCTLYATVEVAAPADAERLALADGDIVDRLKHAIATATNDDETKPLTDKRARKVERIDTMLAAIDEIERLRAGGWREDMQS